MQTCLRFSRVLLSSVLFLSVALASARAADPIHFESQIRPILKAHCFACHGEHDMKEGKLDARLVRTLLTGGESGAAIVPGKHAESLLWKRISSGEMPPSEKKLSDRERSLIAAWIDAGAKTARPEPESISDDELTDEEKSFWSFQPVRNVAIPEVRQRDLVRNAVDAFLLARLESSNLSFSVEADKITLVRRATFDLLGLPPTPEQVAEFLTDSEPDAFERLVDRLLESPHYGERWARHWLDVAGYADSDGFTEKDLERKWAFKYRDWLIQAINADRPWNELIVEQLAGDELVPPPYRDLTPEQSDKLIATGFLRLGPDGTGDSAANQDVARNECVAETIKIVSTSLLGLTVGCAQCHAHRYDPISQVDYYRMRAIFEPALDWKDWKTPNARLISLWTAEQNQLASQCDAEIKRLEKDRLAEYEALSEKVREESIKDLADELKQAIREAAKTPVAKRTAEQKKLLTDHPKAAIPVGTLLERNAKAEYKQITDRFAKLIDAQRQRRPTDNFAHCLTEVPGKTPKTFLFFRGEFAQPKQEVQPGELAVIAANSGSPVASDDPSLPTTGRRLAYARHLTSPRHPLVARVFVNRIWMHHFGRGLVATPADFGHLGERPSHPELLDWLAADFVGKPEIRNSKSEETHSPISTPHSQHAWSLKRLHRLLMTSTAYRQSSRRRPELDAVDPDNRLLGRMSLRRLEAETVRDAMLFASGRLTRKLFGAPVPITPDETGQIIVGVDTRDTAGRPTGKKVPLFGEELRRSIYIAVRRSMPLAMLETFDSAILAPNCVVRTPSTVAPQSLMLMNNEFASEQASQLALLIETEAGSVPAAQAQLAWRRTLAREPTEAQVQNAVAFLTEQAESSSTQPAKKGNSPAPAQQALANLCQALLISNAFLYVD